MSDKTTKYAIYDNESKIWIEDIYESLDGLRKAIDAGLLDTDSMDSLDLVIYEVKQVKGYRIEPKLQLVLSD